MYKIDYEKDFDHLIKLLRSKVKTNSYSTIYFKTNEYLKKILDNFPIKNKEVLTVLGSGDQALHLYNRGAKSVDLFDKNKLSIYYYYLRIWVIKYLNKFYPNHFNKYSWSVLRKKVITSSFNEKQVKNFWDLFFEKYEKLSSILEYDPCTRDNEINNLSLLKQNDNYSNINFYNVDIAAKNLDLNKKYDIIYTSNISDWICSSYSDAQKYKNKLVIYRNNLRNLLKDNGIIICAYAYVFSEYLWETNIFSEFFNRYRIEPKVECDCSSLGYYYVKK